MNGTGKSATRKKDGLRCPKCGHTHFRVVYTRPAGGRVARRRTCHMCKVRFTTWEHIVSR